MLVCLQFDSIGRRKRQGGRPGTRQVQCTSASHSLTDAAAAAHSDYESVTARTVAELEDGVRVWFTALEVFDLSAVGFQFRYEMIPIRQAVAEL